MREDEINDIEGMMARAKKLGDERAELEKRNKLRRAKGRKPLPDDQERKDAEVLMTKYRTGDYTTVDGSQAIRLFELRKAAKDDPDLMDDEDDEALMEIAKRKPGAARYDNVKPDPAPPPEARQDPDVERAVREAAAARTVQDMKAGRIDHAGNWSPAGQKLEGGDDTSLPSSRQVWGSGGRGDEGEEAPESVPEATNNGENPAKPKKPAKQKKGAKASNTAKSLMPVAAGLNEFQEDLYERLRVSFEALETTMSDMQGRLAEIVTASAANAQPGDSVKEDEAFKELLERKIPVTFDVGGTKMKFDAVTVFHASPCITVVSKSGSATIMPKPGARLKLSYEMDGKQYSDDPVTFLGTRFDLPMFGLSFVGFIRDVEADMLDAEAPAGDM
jgi:hypothetical protein